MTCPEQGTDQEAISGITCPKCGGPAIRIGQCLYRQEGKFKSVKTDYYRCNNQPKCVQKVPYPGEADGKDSDWDLEFVIVDGQKEIVRPAADEFA